MSGRETLGRDGSRESTKRRKTFWKRERPNPGARRRVAALAQTNRRSAHRRGTRGGEPDVPSSVRKDRHVPGTSGLSIRSFTAGVAGDTSASAPILACVWSFSAGAPSEAISPDAPDGCGSRTSSPEVHPPARGNPGATPALSPTEARARSRRLARGFLTPDPIKRRATKGSDWGGDSNARERGETAKVRRLYGTQSPIYFRPIFERVFQISPVHVETETSLETRRLALSTDRT